jgi:hypothetical protein
LDKAGVTFSVAQPIPQVARGFYAFDVTLLSPQLAGQKVAFYGSGQDLNEMTSAIEFVEKAAALDLAEQALEGFAVRTLDTLKSLGGLIWRALTSPIELAEQIGNTVSSAREYASSVLHGESSLGVDALNLVRNIQREEVSGITAAAGFTYDTCPIPQARDLALKLARARLLGKISSDAALAIGSSCAASAVLKAFRRTGVVAAEAGEGVSLIARALRPTRSAELAKRAQLSLGDPAKLQAEVALRAAEETIRHQSDPIKLATVGLREANPRLNRILAAMNSVEQAGEDLIESLRKWLSDEIHPDFYYSRRMTIDRLTANYADAKSWGLFDDQANLQSLARGRSATITKGPYVGQKTHVDHIIPVSLAPELNANLANLRVLPAAINIERSNILDQDALTAMENFREIGWKYSAEVAPAQSARFADHFAQASPENASSLRFSSLSLQSVEK